MDEERITEHPILGTYDKGRLVTFTYDGKEMQGYEGEPIAMALHANGSPWPCMPMASWYTGTRQRSTPPAASSAPSAAARTVSWSWTGFRMCGPA